MAGELLGGREEALRGPRNSAAGIEGRPDLLWRWRHQHGARAGHPLTPGVCGRRFFVLQQPPAVRPPQAILRIGQNLVQVNGTNQRMSDGEVTPVDYRECGGRPSVLCGGHLLTAVRTALIEGPEDCRPGKDEAVAACEGASAATRRDVVFVEGVGRTCGRGRRSSPRPQRQETRRPGAAPACRAADGGGNEGAAGDDRLVLIGIVLGAPRSPGSPRRLPAADARAHSCGEVHTAPPTTGRLPARSASVALALA